PIPATVERTAFASRFAGCRLRAASPAQRTSQMILAARNPTVPAATKVVDASRPLGHNNTASTAYSNAAPGTPDSALAPPLSNRPRSSANHQTTRDHTIETVSPAL